MLRTQQVMDATAAQRIVDAAVDGFFERGFAGTTMREIAAGAGVPVGCIYAHHDSKLALLHEIVASSYDALVAQTLAALADAPADPAARLDAVIWAQADFNVRHARLSWVAQTELRSLPSAGREPLVAKRRRLEGIVGRIIADGVDEGAFLVADPAAVSRALLSLCAAIPTWCEPLGDKTSRRVAHTYRELAARMTGQRVAPSARPVQRGRRAAARAAA